MKKDMFRELLQGLLVNVNDSGVNHPPPGSEGNSSLFHSVPSSLDSLGSNIKRELKMDPKTLLVYITSYNGDANTLYNYLNSAKQWLMLVGGESPENTMLLISKLEGKASQFVSMMDHEFKWFPLIEEILKSECGDNR
ncbi:unnamed protein product [Pieris brassicae]|uniref:Uncharacterized protein n=1 Tax=Pieris brassicae TaxID=7116 RepID=A0A9P0TLR5_PIEBR|nr:unnamed protein product [Pieris brassicae]